MEFNKPNILNTTSGNAADNFEIFKEEVLIYFAATETEKKPVNVQVARLKNLLGPDALQIYKTLKEEKENETVVSILNKLEAFLIQKKNETIAIFKFFSRKQSEHETFDQFYIDLKNLIQPCQFSDQEHKMLKSQIILGVYSKSAQENLLREDFPLDKVVDYCKSLELASEHFKQINSNHVSVNVVHFEPDRPKPMKTQLSQQNGPAVKSSTRTCFRCGFQHKGVEECPALNKQCTQCRKVNHFANVCWSQSVIKPCDYSNRKDEDKNNQHQNDQQKHCNNAVGVLSVNTIKDNSSKQSFHLSYPKSSKPTPNVNFSKQLTFCHDFQNYKCWRYHCKYIHCTRGEEEIFKRNSKLRSNSTLYRPRHVLRPDSNDNIYSLQKSVSKPTYTTQHSQFEPYLRRMKCVEEENLKLRRNAEELNKHVHYLQMKNELLIKQGANMDASSSLYGRETPTLVQ